MTDINLPHEARLNVQRRAQLEQLTAGWVDQFESHPKHVLALRAVFDEWDRDGICVLDHHPKEIHDVLRGLAGWATMYLSLAAMDHIIEDAAAESEATG